jgi:hypothetical protein
VGVDRHWFCLSRYVRFAFRSKGGVVLGPIGVVFCLSVLFRFPLRRRLPARVPRARKAYSRNPQVLVLPVTSRRVLLIFASTEDARWEGSMGPASKEGILPGPVCIGFVRHLTSVLFVRLCFPQPTPGSREQEPPVWKGVWVPRARIAYSRDPYVLVAQPFSFATTIVHS